MHKISYIIWLNKEMENLKKQKYLLPENFLRK